ncbi:sensor kinase, two-component system (plasmid) [Rhodococcus jostii RHA1]|uniref:Sensor kinase, two-component system n=2 Tax=Nocardiaceae TaxID=85025 RepID=Q0RWM1_RHOJR|nr:sensor kinase, two-component system [Rhodococcus jostii RHA1]
MKMEIDTVRSLRESPGITTTLALSGDTRDRVVVRRLDLSMTGPWSWHWLEDELEAMRRARLPHIVPTLIARRGPDHADLTRPFIAGRDIREWSAQEPRQSIDVQLKLMCNLFYALARLHRMGIAHGGLKPANIMLTEGNNQLVLLDASVTRTQLAAVTHPVEVPEDRYLLSERPGLAYPTAGFTADIFAAGWVLLEATAAGNRTASVLRRADPRPGTHAELSHLIDIVGAPAPLRPIFLKLLSPLAGIRYESAEDVLAALEAVLATGGGENAHTSAAAPPRHCGPLAYAEPPLVGRHNELATLTACADGATRSSGAVTCLSGESGVGKSRLLDAVATHASTAGVTVMRAGAFDHAPARPLGLFAGPFCDVGAYLTAHPIEAERVRAEMGELLPVALEQVPELTAAFGDPPAATNSDGGFGDRAVTAAPTAVARLLRSVFTHEQPGLIVVDDCQWADDLSWQVLAKLASTISMEETRSQSNVSLIFSCRTEAVAQVRAWGLSDIEFLDLQPLSAADTEELIRSIGDRIPDEVIPYVTKYSKGNPLETLLVFRALIDSSALTLESDRWVVDESEMASLPLQPQSRDSDAAAGRDSAQMDVFVSARLSPLSTDTQQAIRQSAVLGRRFSSRLLCEALEASPKDVDQLLLEATQHGIVRGIADGDHAEFEFTHDRLREAVLRTLTDGARRELHFRAAGALEGIAAVRADYDIAYHFDRSGRAASAVPYALRAGEAGLRHNALDVAEGNFKIAEAGLAQCESADDIARFRVHEGLGTVHMLLGNYDLAAKELVWAYELTGARSGLDSSRVATLLGELAFKTGRFDDAAKWMRQSMHDLGLRVPQSSMLAAVFAVGEVGLLTLGWLSRRIRPGRAIAGTERDRLAARIHNRLVYEWWFVRSPIWLVLAILRGVRFANAARSTRERAQAYSTAAVISGVAPVLAPLALRLADRSLRLRQTADEGWGIAQSHHFRGFVLYAANRYDEAIAAFDTAIAAFDIFGDRWEQVAAMWQKALCLARQGKLHDAGVLARDTYWEGKRRGDRIGAGTALAIWVRCLPGDVSMETISRELRQTNSDDHTTAMLHWARAWRLFHAEQNLQALDAFRQADELLRGSGIRNHFLAPILTSHLQVCRLWHEAGPAWTTERRLQAKTARRLLTRARWSAIVFWGERPAVLREWALMSFSRGHKWRGRMILAAASRSASRYSAQGELAACALVATLVGLKPRRGPLRLLPPVTKLCRPLGIRVDRGIVESAHSRDALVGRGSARHQALLDAVSSIVASEDIDEVLDKLRDATFATTTARRVEISRDLPVSVDTIDVPNASPASMSGDSGPAGEAREMKLTERVAKPVVWDDVTEISIVAAFPLGESEHHGPTMEVLAALAGAVIEREGLRRESMERIVEVQEAERGRIARDLHDEFGHLFAGVMDGLGSLQSSKDAATRQTATDVRTIVRKGIQIARTVAWSLRPSGLDDLGLTGCIEQYVEDCRQIYPIRIELTATGQPESVPPAVATAVFRIVQEALTNIGRHSRAAEASVMIVSSADTVRAVIEDNGIGFDLDLVGQRRSLGLIGMRERARLVGGRMSVESRPGQGTTIMVEVPIRR